MRRNVKVYLEDILEAIQKIEEYTAGISEDDFREDTEKQDAVLRRLEVMGEAVKNIPEKVRAQYPDIPWKKIAGMRDVLIHEYFGVNIERAWRVVKKDLPALKKNVLTIPDSL